MAEAVPLPDHPLAARVRRHALSQQARDYWRFLSHHFYFAVESKGVAVRSGDTYASECLNAISLSHDEKLARVAELECRLASAGDDPMATVQQHVLTWWDELATLHQFLGTTDEGLRIRREKELPVYERLGDVRSMLICRANIAITLQRRNRPSDQAEAVEHLRWALAEAEKMQAEKMQLAEVPTLREWLAQVEGRL